MKLASSIDAKVSVSEPNASRVRRGFGGNMPSVDFVIRRGRADEIDRLAPLWRALRDHHATLPAMPPVRSHEDSWEHRRSQYLDWLSEDGYTLLVAERNGQLIGYAMVSVDEGAATWDVGERAAEIETLSVLESERGRGVGSALTEAAAEVATEAGASAVAVGVAHTNADAIRFYEREGFEPFYVLMLSERPRSTRSTVRSGSDGRSRPAAAPGSGAEP